VKTFSQFQEDLNNPPPYKPLVRDYPLTQQQKDAVINSPLPKLLKRSDYSVKPKIYSDVPIPDKTVEPGKKLYPPPSITDDPMGVTIDYHPDLEDPIKYPYVEADPQQNIRYHMRHTPNRYNKDAPIQAQKTSNSKRVVA